MLFKVTCAPCRLSPSRRFRDTVLWRQVDAMTNRAFWSPIWPSLVAKDKKTLLFNMDFAYDFEGACSFTYCAEWRSLLMPHRIYSSTS
jgi:hypothetical protein